MPTEPDTRTVHSRGRRKHHYAATPARAVAVPGRAVPETRYTTGAVARLCGVCMKTAGKWIDSGRLKGYRIPGGQDRRVLRSDLLAFLRREGMPLPPELAARAATALCRVPGFKPLDAFRLGAAVRGGEVSAVLIGPDDGLAAAVTLAREVRRAAPVLLAVLLAPDRGPADVPPGPFDAIFPAGAERAAAAWLSAHTHEDDHARPE